MSPFHRHVDGTGREIGGRWEGWRVVGGGRHTGDEITRNERRREQPETKNEPRLATS